MEGNKEFINLSIHGYTIWHHEHLVSYLHLNRNYDSSERDCRIRPIAVGGLTKRIRNVDYLTIYIYS